MKKKHYQFKLDKIYNKNFNRKKQNSKIQTFFIFLISRQLSSIIQSFFNFLFFLFCFFFCFTWPFIFDCGYKFSKQRKEKLKNNDSFDSKKKKHILFFFFKQLATQLSNSRNVDGFNVSKSISISSGFESLNVGSRCCIICTTLPSLSPNYLNFFF